MIDMVNCHKCKESVLDKDLYYQFDGVNLCSTCIDKVVKKDER